MTALAARRLAALGWRVHARDLLGCGDSSGDFGDASWQDWIDDLCSLVEEVPNDEPVWLWGVRAGALLLPDLLERCPHANVLLWQPVASGRTALTQFLRLKTVAAAVAGRERIDARALRASLLKGRPEEIAGYTISPVLASGLEGAVLDLSQQFRGRVEWLEVALAEPAALAPAGEALRKGWRGRGVAVNEQTVIGDLFWQTQETTECPHLLEATAEAICRSPGAGVLQAAQAPLTEQSASDPLPANLHAGPRNG
jgi:exosortase A-associated hydrolase 2